MTRDATKPPWKITAQWPVARTPNALRNQSPTAAQLSHGTPSNLPKSVTQNPAMSNNAGIPPTITINVDNSALISPSVSCAVELRASGGFVNGRSTRAGLGRDEALHRPVRPPRGEAATRSRGVRRRKREIALSSASSASALRMLRASRKISTQDNSST
jgi:hypothetical protein